jgi:hypothetical protein
VREPELVLQAKATATRRHAFTSMNAKSRASSAGADENRYSREKKTECQGESMNRGSVSIDFVCDSRAYSILSAALGSGYSPDYQEVKSPPGQKQS